MITRRRLLMLLPAAAIAWEHVLAGTPESRAQLQHDRPLVGDADRRRQVHRLRQLRARLRRRKTMCPRDTSAPGSSATTSTTGTMEKPQVDSPNGGKNGFPAQRRPREAKTSLFPRCAITARIRPARRSARWARRSSRPTAWCWWTRNTAWAAAIAFRPVLMAAAF